MAPEGPVDYRFLLANERTFLAYVRTALALQVAGLGVLQFLTQARGGLRVGLGVLLVGIGSYVALTGYLRFRDNERSIRAGAEMHTARSTTFLAAGVVAIPLVAALLLTLLGTLRCLTPRPVGLRVDRRGRLAVAAAKMFVVSVPRPASGPPGSGPRARPACTDRSSRPHSSPNRTPNRRDAADRPAALASASGAVQIAGQLGIPASDGPRGAGAVPDQPPQLHRPRHWRTHSPLRTSASRFADPRRRHQVRQHPRRRRAPVRGTTAGRAL